MAQPTFTFIGDEEIRNIIGSARESVIFAAPSLSAKIANAFRKNADLNKDISQRIIVDADAKALRHGFGELKGLKDVAEIGVDLRTAPGLRIGVLMVDNKAWVFSPTPEIIFDQPDEETFNAVAVSQDFAQQILVSIAPDLSIDKKNPLGNVVIPDSIEPEIGSSPVTHVQIEKIEIELKAAPPQRFDLQRQVNTYNAYFQFVEIHLSNCNIGSFTIPLSDQLVTIVDDNEVSRRLSAKYKLVEPDSKIKKDLKGITDSVNDLRKEYTIHINEKLGRVLAKERKETFEKQVEKIQKWMKAVTGEIEEDLRGEIAANCEKLAKVLVPIVIEREPRYLRNRLAGDFSNENRVSDVIVGTLMPSDTMIRNLVEGMKLEIAYKDITYEMLNQADFVERIKGAQPSRADLFEEGPALKAKKVDSANSRR
jgi:hypothetical protein